MNSRASPQTVRDPRVSSVGSRGVVVCELRESDWEDLRSLRLKALRTEPGAFHAAYADEAGRPADEWRILATNEGEGQRVFGLFDGYTLVGLTAVFTDLADPVGETAVFAMSYIEPEYCGRGFKKIRVSHRRSNVVSRRAIQRHGFVEKEALQKTWPDGTRDDEVIYELCLTET